MDHQILHHFSEEQYIKEMHIPAGYSVGKHVHSFSHFSVLASGRVTLLVDGKAQELSAPAVVNVKAGCTHTIHAHTNAVWLCTHALASSEYGGDPESVDAVLILKGA